MRTSAARLRYWKGKVDDTQNKKFQLSSRPHSMMLKKLELKFQRKCHDVGSEMNNITTKINRNVDTWYCVQNSLFDTIRNALVQHTVKIHFWEVYVRKSWYKMCHRYQLLKIMITVQFVIHKLQ